MNLNTNKQIDIDKMSFVVEECYEELVLKHGCGWFDGGCYTLASAINEVYPETTSLMHVSRKEDVCDHGVVYIPSIDKYFDADGLQTRSELIKKMKQEELVDVTGCYQFSEECLGWHVLEDIKKQIVKFLK